MARELPNAVPLAPHVEAPALPAKLRRGERPTRRDVAEQAPGRTADLSLHREVEPGHEAPRLGDDVGAALTELDAPRRRSVEELPVEVVVARRDTRALVCRHLAQLTAV